MLQVLFLLLHSSRASDPSVDIYFRWKWDVSVITLDDWPLQSLVASSIAALVWCINCLIAFVLISSVTSPFTVCKGHFLSSCCGIPGGDSAAVKWNTVDDVMEVSLFGLSVKLSEAALGRDGMECANSWEWTTDFKEASRWLSEHSRLPRYICATELLH